VAENSRVSEMRMGDGGRWVGLRCGDRWVRGGVVVGADGYNSPVRAFSGIESFGHPYDVHAVVATLHHSPLANHTAFQRFLPEGPIAFLPLGKDATSMVWSTSPALARAYKALGAERLTTLVNLGFFMDEKGLAEVNAEVLAAHERGTTVDAEMLAKRWDDVLMGLSASQAKSLPPPIASIAPKSIASFPLKMSHAESYIGDRTVLVGDAAHTVHPLAGQGLNMGLADAKVLGEVWEDVRKQGGDIGEFGRFR
jgi:ubiquinone biosynthesis monooxygenase Coq6